MGAAEPQRPDRVDHVRDGVGLGDVPQPAGIDSTGTNADEMNVIGKIRMKPTPFAASGEDALIPITAKIQLKA